MSNLILFFDTETTGLPNKKPPTDPNQARLIQLATILAFPEGETLNTLNTLVKIGNAFMHPLAQEAHGISRENANSEGIHPKEAFEKFHSMSESAECLVCHNHNFDFNIIIQRYRDWETDRKSTRLNSSHSAKSRMPSSA